ncbi:hypothetical protein GC177_04740 [bacterium]|nr:hypothetical protein [bacterium]
MLTAPHMREALKIIQRYGPGHIVVNGTSYREPILLVANQVSLWPGTREHLWDVNLYAPLYQMEDSPEVLLIGTGSRMQMAQPVFRQALKEKFPAGIGIESMDTGAACRTYNVLMGEGRRVAACLLPLE